MEKEICKVMMSVQGWEEKEKNMNEDDVEEWFKTRLILNKVTNLRKHEKRRKLSNI